MPAQLAMLNDVIRRNGARRNGLRDHLVRTAEARQRQADALARGLQRIWTRARRGLARLLNGKAREQTPAVDGRQTALALGRASLADAFRRDRERIAKAFRQYILEPLARERRRRIAIEELRRMDDRLLADIGLRRDQIEIAVHGLLAQREGTDVRPAEEPAEQPVPAEETVPGDEDRDDWPKAA